jgi:hypothetical protein
MTEQPSTEPGTEAKCPYCGCGFVRSEAGQDYCWPGCEQQHQLELSKAAVASDD